MICQRSWVICNTSYLRACPNSHPIHTYRYFPIPILLPSKWSRTKSQATFKPHTTIKSTLQIFNQVHMEASPSIGLQILNWNNPKHSYNPTLSQILCSTSASQHVYLSPSRSFCLFYPPSLKRSHIPSQRYLWRLMIFLFPFKNTGFHSHLWIFLVRVKYLI